MTRFQDGSAHGTVLMLKRAPLFLRVVTDSKGKIDALDQITDTPADNETIEVYRREGQSGACFIDRTENGRRVGEAFTNATYRYLPNQPADDQVRSTEAWQSWVKQQLNTKTER